MMVAYQAKVLAEMKAMREKMDTSHEMVATIRENGDTAVIRELELAVLFQVPREH
jgi:hypothetical protein